MSEFITADKIGSIEHISRVFQYMAKKLKKHVQISSEGIYCCHATAADFEDFNNEIDMLPFERLDVHIIVAILRDTFKQKDHLRSWEKWLEKAKVILEERGHDSKEVLCGLIPRDPV